MVADFRDIALIVRGGFDRVAALTHEAPVFFIRRRISFRYRLAFPLDQVRDREAEWIGNDRAEALLGLVGFPRRCVQAPADVTTRTPAPVPYRTCSGLRSSGTLRWRPAARIPSRCRWPTRVEWMGRLTSAPSSISSPSSVRTSSSGAPAENA